MVLIKDWSKSLRTYVALRKRLGREPSAAEREDAPDGLASSIKEKDIINAFAWGWLVRMFMSSYFCCLTGHNTVHHRPHHEMC